jgi:hypothetical protein
MFFDKSYTNKCILTHTSTSTIHSFLVTYIFMYFCIGKNCAIMTNCCVLPEKILLLSTGTATLLFSSMLTQTSVVCSES